MSFTVLSRVLLGSLLAITANLALAQAAGHALSCDTEKAESATLAQAPMGARRVGPHVLEVTTKIGRQKFVDKPPHDEGGLAGVHWRYCGYNAKAKAHLIQKTDEGSFSGELLLDQNGKLLPAGHTVLFSADTTKFLSIEQEDGMDGENWAVYDWSGKPLWKGYAGTTAKMAGVDTVVSTFERPRWTRDGELTAKSVCASGKSTGMITLERSSSGHWSWRGQGKCTG